MKIINLKRLHTVLQGFINKKLKPYNIACDLKFCIYPFQDEYYGAFSVPLGSWIPHPEKTLIVIGGLLIDKQNLKELKAVIAHELAHIVNHDQSTSVIGKQGELLADTNSVKLFGINPKDAINALKKVHNNYDDLNDENNTHPSFKEREANFLALEKAGV